MAVSILFPFLTVPWVGLQCVIVVAFHGHALSLKYIALAISSRFLVLLNRKSV